MEGFHYLFHPVTRRALELAGDGTLGELLACRGADGHARAGGRRPAVVTGAGRWRADGSGLLRPAHHAAGLGHPSIVHAHAEQRTPGVDAWCDVDLAFPGGATGLSANSMVADDYMFTLRIVGTRGDVLVHNFIKPHDDDRLTINTPEGTTVERLGTSPSYTLPTRGVRRPRPARRPATARHRRRRGEHGLHRRRVPRGGHVAALNRRRDAETGGQFADQLLAAAFG